MFAKWMAKGTREFEHRLEPRRPRPPAPSLQASSCAR